MPTSVYAVNLNMAGLGLGALVLAADPSLAKETRTTPLLTVLVTAATVQRCNAQR